MTKEPKESAVASPQYNVEKIFLKYFSKPEDQYMIKVNIDEIKSFVQSYVNIFHNLNT